MTPASPPYPDIQTFCAARAKAECQVATLCAVDASACQMARTTVCVQDAAQATAAPSSRQYVANNAPSCIDAVNQAYGNGSSEIAFAGLVGPGSITDKCERVFSGNLEKNHPCLTDFDCVSNRICASVAGSTQRVCADSVPKNEGDFCADPGSICATNTYCAPQEAGAPQCQPALQAGPCGASMPCVSADRCVGGLCIPRAGAGQSCASSDDCAPAAPYCDPYAGNICAVGVTFSTRAPDCEGYGLGGGPDAGVQSGGSPDAASGPMHDASDATTD
jgi:hypothetical protein